MMRVESDEGDVAVVTAVAKTKGGDGYGK